MMTISMDSNPPRVDHATASDPEPAAVWPDPSPLADWWAKVMRTGAQSSAGAGSGAC